MIILIGKLIVVGAICGLVIQFFPTYADALALVGLICLWLVIRQHFQRKTGA